VSDPAAKQIAVPTADDGRAVAGLDTGAGVRQVRVDPRAHDFDEQTDTLAPQLVAGINPTKITNGEYAPDGRLVAGDVAELVRVIPKAPTTPEGTATREELDAYLFGGGPTGVAAVRGDAKLATPEGLARLDGFLTSGGYTRSELDVAGQRGRVPAAADILFGRFSDWRGLKNIALSMPLRSGRFSDATGSRAADATAMASTPERIIVWGYLAPFDEERRTALDSKLYGTDPDLYQRFARWAPFVEIDPDKLIGKPDPPPEDGDPKPPEPQPPPGGGGGGGEDDEEEEPETDPQQERIGAAYVTPGSGVGLDDDEDDPLEVPSGGAVTTDTIDDGDGIAISPVKDGILVVDGGEEDQIDLGGGPQIDDGDDDDPEDEPVPATHCPIGGKREPVVTVREVVIGGHVFIETRVDGVVVSLVRKEGGILTPTNADANTTPPPPPGGTGEVSSGGKTYTYDGGKLTGVRQDAGGVLTPTGQTPSGPTPPSSGTGTVEYGGKTYTYEGGKVTRVGQNSGGIIGGPAP
jgi:hypothetical protein